MKKAGILAFSDQGRVLAAYVAEMIRDSFRTDMFDNSRTSAADYIRDNFDSSDALIFVGAAGIAVRLAAPYIKSKAEDPAVIVIDELGENVIPILSGHLGGANRLAKMIAERIGGNAVVTTATDINHKFAIDEWTAENGCLITDMSIIKEVSSAILKGEPVGLDPGDFEVSGKLPEGLTYSDARIGICVGLSGRRDRYEVTLNAVPRIVDIGVGCRKGTGSDEFEKFILEMLDKHNIDICSVSAIATIDIKKEEKCLADFCRKYRIPEKFFSADDLCRVEGDFESSDFVRKTTGVGNVCERSAAAGGGRMIIRRTAGKGMTAAAAANKWKVVFE
jgi:Cobalamin biosynthesis protein CbiG